MQSGYVTAGGGKLFYRRWGSGPKALLAFPGYSNTGILFQPLAPLIAAAYTLYAFDLPHHGQSRWPSGQPLLKEDLLLAVKNILSENHHSQCALAAFSLGGRAALSIEELAPELVEKLVLVAPDGLSFNPFYRFVTGTYPGKKLFAHFTEKPGPYLRLLDWLHQKKWVDHSRYHFARYFVQTDTSRHFLKNVWLDLRFLKPDLKKIKSNIQRYQTPACIFMGQYDRVIPPGQAVAFAKGLPEVRVTVLQKGHRLMDSDTFQHMAQCLIS